MSVVAATYPMLKRGPVRDFKLIMKGIGRWRDSRWNQTTLKYTFSTGSTIEFFSNENPDRTRGARRSHLFVNECNVGIDFEAFNQYAIRTSSTIWFDYNPSQLFWADRELVPRDDVDFITVTYKDNDTLPDTILDEFNIAREKAKTSEYWKNFVNVYLEGKIGRFPTWLFRIGLKCQNFRKTQDFFVTAWIGVTQLMKQVVWHCTRLTGVIYSTKCCIKKECLIPIYPNIYKTTILRVSCGRIQPNQNQSPNCNRMVTQSTRLPKDVIR